MLTNQIQHQTIGRQVTFVRHLAANLAVSVIVEVLVIRIENAVTSQATRLMYLEVKTNRRHGAPLDLR
jgi:hypothetical protein